MKLPLSLTKLVTDLKRLPGIGPKTAERLALYIIDEMDETYVTSLSDGLLNAKKNLKHCPICGMIKEEECLICSNELRNHNQIMVLATIKDLIVIENSESYDGLYHILGGTIDFSKGIEPDSLFIDGLIKRINKPNMEIILALNGALDGQLTSSYIEELLKDKNVNVSKIAYGVPVGGDLSFTNKKTLKVALDNRIKIK